MQRIIPMFKAHLAKMANAQLPSVIPALLTWQESIADSMLQMGRRDPRTRKGKVFRGSSGNVRCFFSVQCSKPPRQALNLHIMCRPERKSRTNLPCSGRGNSMKQHFRKGPYLYPIHQGLPLLSRLLYLHQQMLQLLLKPRHHLFSNDPSGIMPFFSRSLCTVEQHTSNCC